MRYSEIVVPIPTRSNGICRRSNSSAAKGVPREPWDSMAFFALSAWFIQLQSHAFAYIYAFSRFLLNLFSVMTYAFFRQTYTTCAFVFSVKYSKTKEPISDNRQRPDLCHDIIFYARRSQCMPYYSLLYATCEKVPLRGVYRNHK